VLTADGLSCGCPRGNTEISGLCQSCPTRFSSDPGDTAGQCTRCAPGNFQYKKNRSTFQSDVTCVSCDAAGFEGFDCPFDSNVATIGTKPNFWRLSEDSDEVLECKKDWKVGEPTPCNSSLPGTCSPLHEGPRCQVCTESLYYIGDNGMCSECPPDWIPAVIMVNAMIFLTAIGYMVYIFTYKPPPKYKKASDRFKMLVGAIKSLGPSKAKSAITYFQIMGSLQGSFDLDPVTVNFSDMMATFDFINVDLIGAFYPSGCLIGGWMMRLFMVAFFPLIVILCLPIFIGLILLVITLLCNTQPQEVDEDGQVKPRRRMSALTQVSNAMNFMIPGQAGSSVLRRTSTMGLVRKVSSGLIAVGRAGSKRQESSGNLPVEGLGEGSSPGSSTQGSMRASGGGPLKRSTTTAIFTQSSEKLGKWWKRALQMMPITIFVIFLFLPQVSRTILSTFDCIPYQLSSGKGALPYARKYYMRRDLSVVCGSDEHVGMVVVAVVFIILWPVGMQCLFIWTLYSNRKALRAGHENTQARATKFLTGGYKTRFFYWETIELFRRLACSGFVVLIPHDYIFLRTVLALMVSVPILVATALLRPFKNPEDTGLSLATQTILVFAYGICAFVRITNSQRLQPEAKINAVSFEYPDAGFMLLALFFVVGLCLVFTVYLYKIGEEFQKQVRHRQDKYAQEAGQYILMGATFFGAIAVPVGWQFFGAVGALLVSLVMFSFGGMVGSIVYERRKKAKDAKIDPGLPPKSPPPSAPHSESADSMESALPSAPPSAPPPSAPPSPCTSPDIREAPGDDDDASCPENLVQRIERIDFDKHPLVIEHLDHIEDEHQ